MSNKESIKIIYDVSFYNKDDAKRYGAKWNALLKYWYSDFILTPSLENGIFSNDRLFYLKLNRIDSSKTELNISKLTKYYLKQQKNYIQMHPTSIINKEQPMKIKYRNEYEEEMHNSYLQYKHDVLDQIN